MTAIGYVRVSTEDQAKEGVSLDSQRSKIEAYCHLKDLELREIVEDAGMSAKNLRWPGRAESLEPCTEKGGRKKLESGKRSGLLQAEVFRSVTIIM